MQIVIEILEELWVAAKDISIAMAIVWSLFLAVAFSLLVIGKFVPKCFFKEFSVLYWQANVLILSFGKIDLE